MDTEIVAKSPSHQLSSDSGIYLYIVVGDNMATTLKVAGCSSAMTWAMTRM